MIPKWKHYLGKKSNSITVIRELTAFYEDLGMEVAHTKSKIFDCLFEEFWNWWLYYGNALKGKVFKKVDSLLKLMKFF